jgi:hypothetical protein
MQFVGDPTCEQRSYLFIYLVLGTMQRLQL